MGPFNGKSHFLYLQSFVKALLDRGHEVTFLTSQSLSHLKLDNYTEVLIDPPFDIHSLCECQNCKFLLKTFNVKNSNSSTGVAVEDELKFTIYIDWTDHRLRKYDE